ncbi:MAG TPA: glycosyl hydrolase family 79 C-terminal domain-containing protein [Solirubrobacteraceae bacterium]|jgi:hypothetical protein|nr:glycosyl hydrolase family 79 C-terminal domain-containing protein [Solirubrobacteraceae bacterium]
MHVPAVHIRRLPQVSAAVTALAVAAWVLAGSPSPSSSPPHPADRSRETLASGEHPRFGQHAHAADPPATAAAPALIASPAPRGTPVSIAIGTRPRGAAIPADFLGLSFEMRSLPLIASWAHRGDLVALLRSLGPGVMRFGGISADEQTAWVPAGAAKPGWAIATVDEADLANLAALARASGWRVLLTVNLAHFEKAAAAQEAAVAHAQLGPYLAGIEVGNEPDLFPRKHLRPPGYGVSGYLPQAAAYIAAIQAAAPGVPIAGPDPSTGVHGLTWVRDAAATLHPQLLTDHYYPLSSCGEHPTVSELLSPTVRLHESEMLAEMLAVARAHRTPLRMDETNNISCEGQPGVSNSFASALWALDWIARGMTAGTVGVNFHDLIEKPTSYAALAAHGTRALAAGELRAAPEWYALLAAHALAGHGGARPLPLTLSGTAPGELSAYALRSPGGTIRLALIDYDAPGSPPLAVSLGASRGLRGGAILRLTGPSPAATQGTRLGGRTVSAGGTWAPASALPAVHGRPGALSLQLSPGSAAVVTLPPQRRRARAALPG